MYNMNKNVTSTGLILIGGDISLDFCNTIEKRPEGKSFEALFDYRALIQWGIDVGILEEAYSEQLFKWQTAEIDTARQVFERALNLRSALHGLFVAYITESPFSPDDLATLNRNYQSAVVERVLVAGTEALIWQWRRHDTPELLIWTISLAAVELLTQKERSRLRQCPGCGWLFYDRSRNNGRTWCDMRFCGNRAKNQRYYENRRNLRKGQAADTTPRPG